MDDFCGSQFWDSNTTWNTTHPDWTPCFEKTVLVWIPSLFLFLVAPYHFHFIRKSLNGIIPWNWKSISKILVSLVIILSQVSLLIGNIIVDDDREVHGVDFLYPSIFIVTVCLQAMFVLADRIKGIQASAHLLGFWFLMATCGLFPYRTHFTFIRDEIESSGSLGFISYMVFYPCVCVMFFLNCFADDRAISEFPPRGERPSPELDASYLNKMLFVWLDQLIWKGFKKPVTQDHLWDLPNDNKSDEILRIWDENWKKTVEELDEKKRRNKLKGNLEEHELKLKVFPVMVRTFWKQILVAAIIKLIHDALQFIPPQIIKWLIAFADDPNIPTWKGYFYSIFLLIVIEVQSIVAAQQALMMYEIGLKIKTAVISVIYKKALLISSSAKKESTVGEIVNLMAVDVQRFIDLMSFMNMLWSAPFQISLCIYFLWQLLGPSTLVGVLIMILLIPINAYIANIQKRLQITQMKEKDQRVKMMNEILNGIKVLKLYAWEPSFIDQVVKVREKEIVVLKKSSYLGAAVSFMFTCTPFLVSFFMFMTYVMISTENILSADVIFVSLTLLNILKFPMTMVPMLIIAMVQVSVSLKRLNKFINADELNPDAVMTTKENDDSDAVIIEHGSFSWDDDSTITLKDINIKIKRGSLVGIVGAVGSGKSSLCSVLLGEMKKKSGSVTVQNSIAYVPQQAWIQNDTLENNILFCKEKNTEFYHQVVKCCALEPDFEILPAGDQTEIGEKGINLSGGQKQRVSVARAIYAEAEVNILDDPLSAVDAHVGKQIFQQVIGPEGLLKNKTRILVTHSMNYIRKMDHIIVLKDGRISEQGTYEELVNNNGQFNEFLLQYLTDVDDSEDLDDIKEELENKVGTKVLERQMSLVDKSKSSKGIRESIRRARKSSLQSLKKEEDMRKRSSLKESKLVPDKLILEEKSAIGQVSLTVYSDYIKSIGIASSIFAVLCYSISQIFSVLGNVLLSQWADNDDGNVPSVRNKYLYVYAAFGIAQSVSILFGFLLIARACIQGSMLLHNEMLNNILRNPMSFFDKTPIGRIVNRFAKDVDIMDVTLPQVVRLLLLCLTSVVFTIIIICYTTPLFIVVVIPCAVLYLFIQKLYVTTSRQLKRIESVTRSPIYSHFGESIQGASTIRAYHLQDEFIRQSETKVDDNQRSYYLNIVSYRWLSIRLEFIGNLLTFFAAFFTVTARENMTGGDVGLSISYAIAVTSMLNYLVRTTSDVETNIVSVERLKEYTETPQEKQWNIEETKPPKDWPQQGAIEFRNYSTRYRENLDLVVKDINCRLLPKEKIGIVGRTGAGKSSVTLALFRIIEPVHGTIVIDNVDITEIGLHNLREKLTIIPQDPVLFSGTLRMNLDPFKKYSDDALWNVLEHCHLKSFVSELDAKLEHEISEGGENISLGQRQLVCLGRALLRKTKVLVLDEATAAVDLETDYLIQETIRTEFADCTLITIAHRLNTIMDSTRVIVMDVGKIIEFDTPVNLLNNPKSIFHGMAKDAGLI